MSTYSTNLALELIGTGEQAGVWGTTTNTNLGTLIEQAISGYVTQAVATGTDTTITIPNGATGVARNMYIELTGTGGTNTNLIVPANKKLYFIFNNSTGAVTVKVSGQTGVSVPQGKKVVLTSNGTDIVNGLNYIADFGSNSATITQLTATSATITNLTLTSLVISNLSIASANITTLTATNETISGNLTLSGGTANGVAYLDGSKVVTSGSTLTFDGTNLRVGGSGSGSRLVVRGTGTTSATFSIEAATSGGATRFLVADDGLCRWYGTSNAETMRLDNAGNLGIGTASPAYKLHVERPSYGVTGYFFANDGTRNPRFVIYGSADGTTLQHTWSTGASNIIFASGGAIGSGTEIARFDASGNLGIGTASPSFRLDVAYDANATSAVRVSNSNLGSSATATLRLETQGNTWTVNSGRNGGFLSFNDAGGERARFDNAGNLGIGTTSPAQKLHISAASATSAVRLTRTGTFPGDFTLQSGGYSTPSFLIYDNTAAAERLLIDGSGNLGLGVTPSASTIAQFEGGANLILVGRGNVYASNNATFNSGWKYISTAVAAQYNISGAEHRWFNAASGTAGNAISFTQAMTLTAGGDLGVGTTSPVGTTVSGGSVTANGVLAVKSYLSSNQSDVGIIEYNGNKMTLRPYGATAGTGFIAFNTGGGGGSGDTERARITSGGDFKWSDNGASGDGAMVWVRNGGDGTANSGRLSLAYNTVNWTPGSTPDTLRWDGNTGRLTILTSAKKYKRNITPVTDQQLDKALKLEPSYYQRLEHEYWEYGFIADQADEIGLSEIVSRVNGEINGLDYEKIGVFAIGLIKRHQKTLEQQQAIIEELKAKVAALEAK